MHSTNFSEGPIMKRCVYKRIELFLQPGNLLFDLRLDTSKPHHSISLPQTAKAGRCILCCELCIKGKCEVVFQRNVARGDDVKKSVCRLGRKTVKYCITCNVILCKYCHKDFHSKQVPLPPCSPYQILLSAPSRVTRGSKRCSSDSTARSYYTEIKQKTKCE